MIKRQFEPLNWRFSYVVYWSLKSLYKFANISRVIGDCRLPFNFNAYTFWIKKYFLITSFIVTSLTKFIYRPTDWWNRTNRWFHTIQMSSFTRYERCPTIIFLWGSILLYVFNTVQVLHAHTPVSYTHLDVYKRQSLHWHISTMLQQSH